MQTVGKFPIEEFVIMECESLVIISYTVTDLISHFSTGPDQGETCVPKTCS